jgi:mannitol-1-phosphate 5-dehydrogenase
MKNKIILMGCGAIGRGYIPWMLDLSFHELIFIDANKKIIEKLNQAGSYKTFRVKNGKYEEKIIPISTAIHIDDFDPKVIQGVEACFFSVGPRNIYKAAKYFKGTKYPLILCENEPNTVKEVKSIVLHENVFFAVPDVITSNTAPAHLLRDDVLSISTEAGEFFIEKNNADIRGDISYLTKEELLNKQWIPKLYLHNTPHCIAAYLGAVIGVKYVHEAMQNKNVESIVEGAMNEMLKTLKMKWDISHDFLDWYAKKELKRFKCLLLFDPISRVAREPLRKLELHGRLIGAAQLALKYGVLPNNLIKGIIGALIFEDDNDPDHHIKFMSNVMPNKDFNRYVLGLRPGEPLDLLLSEQIDSLKIELENIKK